MEDDLNMQLTEISNLDQYPISNSVFQEESRQSLNRDGVLVLPGFLKESALVAIQKEGEFGLDKAYFKRQSHNVYLTPNDSDYSDDHVFNRQIISSKGCITDDQIDQASALRVLYGSDEFKNFLCYVLGEESLHPYTDPLSSINLHYAKTTQELGWHFDNSSFAIT